MMEDDFETRRPRSRRPRVIQFKGRRFVKEGKRWVNAINVFREMSLADYDKLIQDALNRIAELEKNHH